jgi:hypothetical protein
MESKLFKSNEMDWPEKVSQENHDRQNKNNVSSLFRRASKTNMYVSFLKLLFGVLGFQAFGLCLWMLLLRREIKEEKKKIH